MSPDELSLQEALQILGAPPGTDGPSLRRAYLRRVKQFPPEKDPQGFQRLRAAFDRATAPWAQEEAQQLLETAERSDTSPLTEDSTDLNSDFSPEEPTAPPAPSPAQLWMVQAESAFEHAESALKSPQPLSASVLENGWSVLLSTCPDIDLAWEFYWEFLFNREELGAPYLRAAASLGWADFQAALFTHHPHTITPGELQQAISGGEIAPRELLSFYIDQGDPRAAFPLGLRLIQEEPAPQLPVYLLLQLVLFLEAEAHFPEAEQLFRAFADRVAREQNARALFSHTALTWHLLEEYFAQVTPWPTEARQLFGKVARSGDWEKAGEEFQEQLTTLSVEQKQPLVQNVYTLVDAASPDLRVILFPQGAPPSLLRFFKRLTIRLLQLLKKVLLYYILLPVGVVFFAFTAVWLLRQLQPVIGELTTGLLYFGALLYSFYWFFWKKT